MGKSLTARRLKEKAGSLGDIQKAAMLAEIDRQLIESNHNNNVEIAARVLWVLHEEFGFGKDRLKRYFDAFDKTLNDLDDYYQMEEKDEKLLCTYKLQSIGVDISKWEQEAKVKEKKKDVSSEDLGQTDRT